jgi:hypothetical protein
MKMDKPPGLNMGDAEGLLACPEFCARFKARMLARVGDTFEDGGSIAEYADMAALAYFDDPKQRDEGPEECADADISYWGDE